VKLKDIAKSKDIEALLSYIMLFEKIHIDKKENIEALRKELEKKIKELCSLELDYSAPHNDFLNKITARKNNDARVQLFTTNYDTLFEQAANKAGFVIIDGFSFTQPREFAGKWFDLDIVNREKTRLKQEESFVSKVFHLYKLHGSVNWTKENNKVIQKGNSDNPLIIYPANEKYESSYEQPYFEMMSRFQQALRKEETLLIVIGFGFQDKHIQNVIVEAVEQNPSFQLLIVNYRKNKDGNETGIVYDGLEDFIEKIKDKDGTENLKAKRKVSIVFETFKSFTDNYPEKETYYSKDKEDETV
jgi:NAD-dependent SIR2 family protein deacetylase